MLASPLQLPAPRNHWAAQQSQGKKMEWILLAKYCPLAAPSPALHSRAEGRKKHGWQTFFVQISSGWTHSGLLLYTCDPAGGYDAMPVGWASRAEKPKSTSASPALEKFFLTQITHPKKLLFKEDYLALLGKGWYLQAVQGYCNCMREEGCISAGHITRLLTYKAAWNDKKKNPKPKYTHTHRNQPTNNNETKIPPKTHKNKNNNKPQNNKTPP